jgi:hypothetical protein
MSAAAVDGTDVRAGARASLGTDQPTRDSGRSRGWSARAAVACVCTCGLAALLLPAAAGAFDKPFLGSLRTLTRVASTEPANGDLNPYGVVVVPSTTGSLVAGDILVSNFNNGGTPPTGNLQGTGTTIVEVPPHGGHVKLFAQINPKALAAGACPGGVGLTTALATLPQGYVVVGSLPTENGKSESAMPGCLLILDSTGHVVSTIPGTTTGPIDGPWDMTAVNQGPNTTLFVTNVLNGTVKAAGAVVNEGTVVRIRLRTTPHRAPTVTSTTVIGTGFPERTDEAALVVGPTGVALGEDGTLYVADTVESRIAAIPGALGRSTPVGSAGTTVATGGYLNGPLGMTLAPNGDILTANANDGNLVETTPEGAEFQPFDTGIGAGGLFGLALAPGSRGLYLVNDAENSLDLLH